MEKLLSNTWENVFLNEVKQEALVNARYEGSVSRDQAIYLFDNKKMDAFEADVVLVQSDYLSVLLVSRESFVKALEGDCPDKDSVVVKAQSYITDIDKDNVKISGADFAVWAEKVGLENLVNDLNLNKKLKM